ncbi:hypothetical protein ACQEVC_04720 [Plantactinospora sp. CA-294935]
MRAAPARTGTSLHRERIGQRAGALAEIADLASAGKPDSVGERGEVTA